MALIEINPLNPLERSLLHRRRIRWTGPWRLYHVTGYEEQVIQRPLRRGECLLITKIPVEPGYTLFNVHQLLLHAATMSYIEIPLAREFYAKITAIGDYFAPLFGVRGGIMAAIPIELFWWERLSFVWAAPSVVGESS
jgi:hypothetical protein